jgi:hypothetical protein
MFLMRAVVRTLVILALVLFALRGLGFRDGASVRTVTTRVNGLGGVADLTVTSGHGPAGSAIAHAGRQACKPPGGALKTLLDFRGPKVVFVNEVIPSGLTFRFRWDCRLQVLRIADQ